MLPGATTSGSVRAGAGSASTLTVADVDAIKNDDPAVANESYEMRQIAQVQYGSQNRSTVIHGRVAQLSDYLQLGRGDRPFHIRI